MGDDTVHSLSCADRRRNVTPEVADAHTKCSSGACCQYIFEKEFLSFSSLLSFLFCLKTALSTVWLHDNIPDQMGLEEEDRKTKWGSVTKMFRLLSKDGTADALGQRVS